MYVYIHIYICIYIASLKSIYTECIYSVLMAILAEK